MHSPTTKPIDINADLGEGITDDALLMPWISSCNIACGGHAGDKQTIRNTLMIARQHAVKTGAHPGYPDRENFGRKAMTISSEKLTESLMEQLELFFELADEVHHIKAHGALYNQAANDIRVAESFLEAIQKLNIATKLYVPYQSEIHRLAQGDFELEFEAFIDRGYTRFGSLVPRKQQGAIHETPEQAWEQLRQMILEGHVSTMSGKNIPVVADTYCIHGDHPKAVAILEYIHRKMKEHNIYLR